MCRPRPLLCESAAAQLSSTFNTYTKEAKVPVVRNGRPNPAAYKQISSGSILGTCGAVKRREDVYTSSLGILLEEDAE